MPRKKHEVPAAISSRLFASLEKARKDAWTLSESPYLNSAVRAEVKRLFSAVVQAQDIQSNNAGALIEATERIIARG